MGGRREVEGGGWGGGCGRVEVMGGSGGGGGGKVGWWMW